jgi:aminoglycoside phosphotransferase (APT) family kinase protein
MLTERDVRALLDTTLPVEPVFLGEEFETWAVGDDLVAKFSRTEYDGAKVPLEVAVHPLLRELLGEIVPAIRSSGDMDESGFRFIVHERASGTQGQTQDGVTIRVSDGLAEDIGRLLGRLHTVEAATVSALGLGERRVSYELPVMDERVMREVTDVLGDAISRFLAAAPPEPSARRVLCHTDIKGEHVFVDDDRARVTTIIDWADTEVCDPARDYAGLAIWLGPAFARAAIAGSGEDDDELADRAIWLAEARAFDWMNEVLTGRENAPIALIRQQLRSAFGVSA